MFTFLLRIPKLSARLLLAGAVFSGLTARSVDDGASTRLLNDSEGLELVRTISAHQQAARERLKSILIEQETEREYHFDPVDFPGGAGIPLPKGTRVDRRRGVWAYRGPLFRTDFTMTSQVRGHGYREEINISVVLNDDYLAELHRGKYGAIYLYSTRPGEGPTEKILYLAEGWMNPDPRRYGFGAGRTSLHELLNRHPAESSWTVHSVDENATKLYRITRIGPPDPRGKSFRHVFTVDPEKDFLVRHAELYDRDGVRFATVNVELMLLSNGSWFPRRIEDIDHGPEKRALRITVTKVSVDAIPEASWFSMERFDFDPASTILVRIDPDGASQRMGFYEGEWIPLEIIPEVARPQQPP